MPEFHLSPRLPLGGYEYLSGGIEIREPGRRALVSVAASLNNRDAVEGQMNTVFDAAIPMPGHTTTSGDDALLFLGLQKDQFLALFDDDRANAEAFMARVLPAAHVTDQSDNWVMLSVTGEGCRDVLERICPVDLHASSFAEGGVARTLMEHLSVIIHRHGTDSFLLLSPASSAGSFAHAVECAALGVL